MPNSGPNLLFHAHHPLKQRITLYILIIASTSNILELSPAFSLAMVTTIIRGRNGMLGCHQTQLLVPL
jgi:hypothetical protein